MSDGATHAKIAWGVEMLIVGTSITLSALDVLPSGLLTTEASIGLAAGGAMGILLTPDIDHDEITFEELRWYHFGRVFGWAWQIFWAGYPILFRHRGWSHFPVIGTATRVIYIAIQFLVIHAIVLTFTGTNLIANVLDEIHSIPYDTLQVYIVSFFAAWIVQDSIHFVTDIISTRLKRSPFNHI